MKKIGVTGAAGFVGSHLCERLLAEDYEVVGVDDMSYGSMANMEPFLHHRGFKFEVLDCTQRRPLRAAFDGCDAIMHLAALSNDPHEERCLIVALRPMLASRCDD